MLASSRPVPRAARRLLGAAVFLFCGAAAVVAADPLALRPLWTVLRIKVAPHTARTEHLVRLRDPATGQTIVILGTTHHHLFTDDDFSIWHVKAAALHLGVDTLLLEMLPDASSGDGPVEMPFLRALADQHRVPVCGIDASWDAGWRARQQAMFQHVLAALRPAPLGAADDALPAPRSALLVSGYLHTAAFRQQLEGAGFVTEPWSDVDKQRLLAQPVERALPPGFREALQESLERKQEATPPGAAEPWEVTVRRRVLAATASLPVDEKR